MTITDRIRCFYYNQKYRRLTMFYIYLGFAAVWINEWINKNHKRLALWLMKKMDAPNYSINIKLKYTSDKALKALKDRRI